MNTSITIVGRVVAQPVKKSFPDKLLTIVEFSVAVKGKGQTANFFDVKTFNGLSERAFAYITKGREIVVTGSVDIEEYTTKDGKFVKKYVVIANGFHLCGPKTDVLLDVESVPRTQAKTGAA